MDNNSIRLHLVRHGQTEWNVEKRYQGQLDQTSLNKTGLAQALGIAHFLQDRHLTALYSSPLKRARQTSQILSAALRLPMQVDPRLTEVNHGDWQGKLLEEVRSSLPEGGDPRLRDPKNGRAPGGESLYEVYQRMAAAADDYAKNHPDDDIVIVSHGVSIATLICKTNGIPLDEVYRWIPDNTDIVTIKWPNDTQLIFSGGTHDTQGQEEINE